MGYASLAHTTHFGTLVALPFIDVFLLGVRSQQVLAYVVWFTVNSKHFKTPSTHIGQTGSTKARLKQLITKIETPKGFEMMATAFHAHGDTGDIPPFQLLNLEVEPCFPMNPRGSPSFTSMLNRLSPFFSRGQVTQKQYSERQCTDLSPQCLHLTDLVALDSQDEASKGTRFPLSPVSHCWNTAELATGLGSYQKCGLRLFGWTLNNDAKNSRVMVPQTKVKKSERVFTKNSTY